MVAEWVVEHRLKTLILGDLRIKKKFKENKIFWNFSGRTSPKWRDLLNIGLFCTFVKKKQILYVQHKLHLIFKYEISVIYYIAAFQQAP